MKTNKDKSVLSTKEIFVASLVVVGVFSAYVAGLSLGKLIQNFMTS